MSKAVQLKKKAAEYEQKKQYDRALTLYVQAIEAAKGEEEIDIPLHNRIGDLYLRQSELEQAVTYYERAVDLYADGGFFNNAIALCNKVLRHAPSRNTIYYKLGKISARKGFNSDAKQNFLEYASRMQKAGQLDEAFRALKEFADLCSGQDDVRLMLAEQLARAGRDDEALEQLQIVHDTMMAEDRTIEANATLDRIRAIDPAFEPKRSHSQQQRKRDGLVFIDVDTEDSGDRDASADTFETSEPLRPTATDIQDATVILDATAIPDPILHTASPAVEVSTDAIVPLEGLELTTLVPDSTPEEMTLAEPVADTSIVDTSFLPPILPLDDDFVDLGQWLRDTQPPPNPRMTGEDEEQSTHTAQQSDFSNMLETFKRGVEQNVDEADSESHYDLGVAYMEMGLLTEGIAEFQKVLRGDTTPERRVRAYESLGQCFIERGEYKLARMSLQNALNESHFSDDKLVGVLYLYAYATEALGEWLEAEAYYRRVIAVDISFRDTGDRLRHATDITKR